MALLLDSLRAFFKAQGVNRTYWLAYSGGLDSHVLLHACASLRADLSLSLQVVHINHSLSPHAAAWAAHCADECRRLDLPYQQAVIDANAAVGDSPEACARAGRYAVFAKLLAPGDVLLTAHHQDDQAETVLLQLCRGAGPKGLAAMPVCKVFAQGFLARPLLAFTRAELQAYAVMQGLQWVDDESNANTDFTRNFIRHAVLPLLQTRWPSIAATLTRVAAHCAEAQALLEDIAHYDLQQCLAHPDRHTLSVTQLRQLSAARQRQVLRGWIDGNHYPLPSAVKLQQIQRDFLGVRDDKAPCMQWQQVELRRYLNELYLMPRLSAHDATQVWQWDMTQPLSIPAIGQLEAIGDLTNVKPVTVRFRQGSEVCQLPGRQHHHELKKLFQQWGVPPWQRDRVPLIYYQDRLVTVVGYFVEQAFAAQLGVDIKLHPV